MRRGFSYYKRPRRPPEPVKLKLERILQPITRYGGNVPQDMAVVYLQTTNLMLRRWIGLKFIRSVKSRDGDILVSTEDVEFVKSDMLKNSKKYALQFGEDHDE